MEQGRIHEINNTEPGMESNLNVFLKIFVFNKVL